MPSKKKVLKSDVLAWMQWFDEALADFDKEIARTNEKLKLLKAKFAEVREFLGNSHKEIFKCTIKAGRSAKKPKAKK